MIVAGIASIREREHLLRKTLKSIYPQVNKVFAVLNNYSKIPDWIVGVPNIIPIIGDNKLGDASKFLFTCDYTDDYYLTFDDDLLFPSNYVPHILEAVDKYDGIVSYHGRTYPRPFADYMKWLENHRCISEVHGDHPVDIVGTGCCAFHTSRLKVNIADFKYRNMADVFISVLAHQQNVPMWVLAHERNYIKYLYPEGETIWHTEKDTTRQTELLGQVLQ
jgi:hypothetical protein